MTKTNASGKKTVYPHVVMRSAAKWALKVAENINEGSFYQSLLCCLAMAFSVEAYLNVVGGKIFSHWSTTHDKKTPKEKLKVIATKIGYKLDHKSAEYQAFIRVFALRKSLVHGKVESISGSWNTKHKGSQVLEALQTDWEKLGTPVEAKKIYERCVKLANELHAAAGLPGRAFGSSMHGIASVH